MTHNSQRKLTIVMRAPGHSTDLLVQTRISRTRPSRPGHSRSPVAAPRSLNRLALDSCQLKYVVLHEWIKL